MDDRAIVAFAHVARSFCQWAEQPPGSPDAESLAGRSWLCRLYAAALELPSDVEVSAVEHESCSDERWKRVFKRFGALPINWFSQVPDSRVIPGGEPVAGDVADDLADLFRDLWDGLQAYDSGSHQDAASAWRRSFEVHWGSHVTNALVALHAVASGPCEPPDAKSG